MAGFLGSYADAYDTAERIDTNRLQQQRTRIADQAAAQGRMERLKKADELRRQVGEGDAGALPAPIDIPGGGPALATPAAPATPVAGSAGRVAAPRSISGIYANSSLLPNQMDNETQRLARMRAPGTVDPRSVSKTESPESVARANSPQAARGRAAELRRLNPAGEGVEVTPLQAGSATDQPAINRLKAKDAEIRGKVGSSQYDKPTPYDDLISRAAQQHGVDATVFKRLLGTESSFDPNAVGAQTPQGRAHGIAQIMTDIHGVPPEKARDPAFAIPFAAKLLGGYLQRAGGDYERALQMYKGAVSEKGKADMAGPISQILAGAGRATTAAMPVSEAQAQTPQQFTPEQFFAAAPQVSDQARMARLRIDQIRRMAAIESDPAALQQMQSQLTQLQMGLQEAQLYELAARGNTDMGALSQLVQLAGVSVARTPQGFVEVDRATGKAVSPPMSAGQLAQNAFQFLSAQARAQAAARSQKLFDASLDTQGKLAVEGAKTAGNLQVEELKANATATRALQELAAKDRTVEIKATPEGQAFAVKGGRAFVYVAPQPVDGYTTMGGFQEIPMPR